MNKSAPSFTVPSFKKDILAALQSFSLPLSETDRPRCLEALQSLWQPQRTACLDHFLKYKEGHESAKDLSALTDQFIQTLFTFLFEQKKTKKSSCPLALIAVGGYGRGELAPSSDLDLLFLHEAPLKADLKKTLETFLYLLWDLGFHVGQSVRTNQDCLTLAQEDITVATALLERRFIAGNKTFFETLNQSYENDFQKKKREWFVNEKLQERSTRHKKFGTTKYVLEPDLKEGKGALRDIHTLLWIAKFYFHIKKVEDLFTKGIFSKKDLLTLKRGEDLLWTYRFYLHYLTGRNENRLSFDIQPEVAKVAGLLKKDKILPPKEHNQKIEKYMKTVFSTFRKISFLTRILCATLEKGALDHTFQTRTWATPLNEDTSLENKQRYEELFEKDFPLSKGRLTLKRSSLQKDPRKILTYFLVLQEQGLQAHPQALQWIGTHLSKITSFQDDPQANETFLAILTAPRNPAPTLRLMSETGVLQRFIPEFEHISGQMQFDRYHHYTVEEHSILAVEILHEFEQGKHEDQSPVSTENIQNLASRRALFVAVFLHDIGKGYIEKHEIVGAQIAEKLCQRFGLNTGESALVVWLVRHHLSMTHTAFRFDLEAQETIETFAQHVCTLERLRLLQILTGADIRAVGPGTWTYWKSSLLRQLYELTEAELQGKSEQLRDEKTRHNQTAFKEQLQEKGWSLPQIRDLLKNVPSSYWHSTPEEILPHHISLLAETPFPSEHSLTTKASTNALPFLGIKFFFNPETTRLLEAHIYTQDQPSLFSLLCGAFAVAGCSIISARINTFSSGHVLNSFFLRTSAGEEITCPYHKDRIEQQVRAILGGNLESLKVLEQPLSLSQRHNSVFRHKTRIEIDNQSSPDFTLFEVSCTDSSGVLYQISSHIAKQGLSLSSASITTFGRRVIDSFYLEKNGKKITDEAELNTLKESLINLLKPLSKT